MIEESIAAPDSSTELPAGTLKAPQTLPPETTRNLLLVAYHFPPQGGSSGYLRSLKFGNYLLHHAWRPTVLSIALRAYERLDDSPLQAVSPQVEVVRAFGMDAQQHLAIHGRYLKWSALPDRWATWFLGAVPAGLSLIRRKHIDVICTTFPIATSVLIGLILHRISGKPWVVDFRDSMTEDDYPRDATVRRVWRWIERQAVRHAAMLVFTAPSARQMYLARYPELPPERCVVIQNGYDEEDFSRLVPARRAQLTNMPCRLLHAGLIYPSERDPRPFFRALARLKSDGKLTSTALQVNLRASGNEKEYAHILYELGIDDLVHLLPAVPYAEVLQEGADADALLLLQAGNCNHQIPAKAYEYLRLGRPILALTDHLGDTAALLRATGGATILDIADEAAIYHGIPDFLEQVNRGQHALPDEEATRHYSRRNQAYELAIRLNGIVAGSGDSGR